MLVFYNESIRPGDSVIRHLVSIQRPGVDVFYAIDRDREISVESRQGATDLLSVRYRGARTGATKRMTVSPINAAITIVKETR